MRVKPVTSRDINTTEARNESLSSEHYIKNRDNAQVDHARLVDEYFSSLLGGNRFELADYSTDQQSLTHQIGNAMNYKAYNDIAVRANAWQTMQENQKARGDNGFLELAKA